MAACVCEPSAPSSEPHEMPDRANATWASNVSCGGCESARAENDRGPFVASAGAMGAGAITRILVISAGARTGTPGVLLKVFPDLADRDNFQTAKRITAKTRIASQRSKPPPFLG